MDVTVGHVAVLEVEFKDNGVLFDPITINSVEILNSSGVVVSTITPTFLSIGRYRVSYFVAADAVIGTWGHRWTWRANTSIGFTSQTYEFNVTDCDQVIYGLEANFQGIGSCADSIWSQGSNNTVLTLNSIPKRMKIFITKNRIPYDPGVLHVTVIDESSTTVYSASLALGTLLRHSTGSYYIEMTPSLFNTAPKRYMLTWGYSETSTSEVYYAISHLYVVSPLTYKWIPRLKLQIDKAVKTNNYQFIGYTDAELYYFLQGGVDEINSFPPITGFIIDTYPESFGQLLINSATVVGLISQKLFAVDTDVMTYSDQGFSYNLDHFARYNSVMTELLAHIKDQMRKFKMEFSCIGSVNVQAVPFFPAAVMLKTSPRGSLFRNLFVAV